MMTAVALRLAAEEALAHPSARSWYIINKVACGSVKSKAMDALRQVLDGHMQFETAKHRCMALLLAAELVS